MIPLELFLRILIFEKFEAFSIYLDYIYFEIKLHFHRSLEYGHKISFQPTWNLFQ